MKAECGLIEVSAHGVNVEDSFNQACYYYYYYYYCYIDFITILLLLLYCYYCYYCYDYKYCTTHQREASWHVGVGGISILRRLPPGPHRVPAPGSTEDLSGSNEDRGPLILSFLRLPDPFMSCVRLARRILCPNWLKHVLPCFLPGEYVNNSTRKCSMRCLFAARGRR